MSAAMFIDCAVLVSLGAVLFHGNSTTATWSLMAFLVVDVLGMIFGNGQKAKGAK